MNTHELVLCSSPDGWSLHAPGSTDEDIANGHAPYLACGAGRPTQADYNAAARKLRTTPNDRAALALVPLLVEARALFESTGLARDGDADDTICAAFAALADAAEVVSDRLLRKAGWRDGDPARELMVRIDDALAEIRAIDRGEPVEP